MRGLRSLYEGADTSIELAALEVYKGLPRDLKYEVDDFLRMVIVGAAPRLERCSRELYDAYAPVRALVRERYGSTVTLYRGEPKDKPLLERKWLSWTPYWTLATHFAADEDYEIIEADVRTSDVFAVFVTRNLQYVEYLVRDREEYHLYASEEQVPWYGFVDADANGRELGYPVNDLDWDPEHARRECPKIDRAMRAVGGKLYRCSINEDDEGATASVLIPAHLAKKNPLSGDYHADVGPYRVSYLRPLAGESLRGA